MFGGIRFLYMLKEIRIPKGFHGFRFFSFPVSLTIIVNIIRHIFHFITLSSQELKTYTVSLKVLRRQLELAGEEWENRLKEWESERGKHEEDRFSLKTENNTLKKQVSFAFSL